MNDGILKLCGFCSQFVQAAEKTLNFPMFYASNPGLYCIRPIIIHPCLDPFAFFSVPVRRNLHRCLLSVSQNFTWSYCCTVIIWLLLFNCDSEPGGVAKPEFPVPALWEHENDSYKLFVVWKTLEIIVQPDLCGLVTTRPICYTLAQWCKSEISLCSYLR